VFGTLHSNSAAKTVDRIIDVFPTGDKEMIRAMLASSLQGVVAQTLLKRASGGRVGAYEVLVGTNAVRNLIRENQVAQLYSMIQTGARYGMVTMEDAVHALEADETITEDEARRALMKATDDGEGHDECVAAASLGGGKIGEGPAQAKKQMAVAGDKSEPSADGDGEDGEYSF